MVGNIVRLTKDCLGNKAGSIGVVYEAYDLGGMVKGESVIFENGNYDGFSFVDGLLLDSKEICEFKFFLEIIGHSTKLENYHFKNVLQLSIDFGEGMFDCVFNKKREVIK